MGNFYKKWKFLIFLSVCIEAGLLGGMKYRPPYDCGVGIREAEIGKSILVETPNYPQKLSHGVNCVIKLKTEPGNNILIRWMGFVLDGCHEGNKVRIVDGDQQQFHCGDKRPPTYMSSTNEVEIAFSVVDMNRKDRGIIYRFYYEASKPRRAANRNRGGKYLVSKYDESTSYYDSQQIQGRVSQTPQAPQTPTQKQQSHQGQQQGQQGNKQHLQNNSQQQHQQHDQQAPQGIPGGYDRTRPPTGNPNRKKSGVSPKPRIYHFADYELLEQLEKAEQEKAKVETTWDRARPYVGLIGSIIAILIPIGVLIKFAIKWHFEREKNIVTFT